MSGHTSSCVPVARRSTRARVIALPWLMSLGLVPLSLVRPPAANAQSARTPVDAQVLPALQWRNLGPFRAGRVSAVSGVLGQAGTFYAGYPGGGLWKTTSAGTTWFPVFDAVTATSSVGAVEVAPSNPDIVYVGTGDMITGGTLDQGNGMYRSTDAGRTWTSIGLEATRHIQTISVDPRSADVLLVGALGDHITANDARGIFRSTDGGRTWVKTLYLDDQTGIAKIARAFDVPDVVYASTVRHWTPPDYFAGKYRSWQFGTVRMPGDSSATRTTLWKSRDGGATWDRLPNTGLPPLEGRVCLNVAIGTNAQRVFLVTNAGLHRSDDGGTTWRQMAGHDVRIRNGQGGYSCGVYTDPKDPDVVYTINTAAYRSTDGGRTFTGIKGAPGGDDPQQLWIDPTNGSRILMGLDQGATVSLDGGATWSPWYNQSTEQLYHIAADNSYPYWVYASQQDAGTIRTRVRGNFGAVTTFDWNAVNGWEWGTIVPDPLDPNTVYSTGTGVVKLTYPSETFINVSPAIDPAARARLTSSSPLVWARWNQHLLLAGLNFLAGTTDGGAHWTRMSPDLGIPAGMDSATAARTTGGRGAIESISASAKAAGEIWVGTSNGMIHLTRDNGRTWRGVSIAGLPNARRANISSIEASPLVAGTAYAAVEYLYIGDHRPYLYRTRDFGRTWVTITNGLPTDEPSGSLVRVLRPDPVKAGLLYAGTESGAYVSLDDGDTWQSLQFNLPNTSVRDLLVKDNDLVIGTHGRGIWVIDDISALRQLTPAIAGAPAHLFTPGRATRVRRNVNNDTPLPPEVPHAENPLDGAIIDYWLGSAATRVTLEVLDASGAVVRHYSSDRIEPVFEATRPPFPDFWVEVPQPLPTGAGAHRVHWDLRHDAPPAFTHGFEINATPHRTPATPEGPLVLPGTYTLRLTANGVTSTARVTVRNDPRARATPAQLAAQHRLQLQLRDGMRASFAAQQTVDTLRATLRALPSGAARDAAAAIARFSAALDSVAGKEDRGPVPVGGASGTNSTFQRLNADFASQLQAQDNADFAPNAPMLAAFTTVSRQLSTAQASLARVLSRDLTVLNTALAHAGVAAIRAP